VPRCSATPSGDQPYVRQGQKWPDIPGNLPALIAIGVGSSIGAQFIPH